jgi:hypothetical protein
MAGEMEEKIRQDQHRFEFFLAEQQIAVDERWKYVERIWEAFKFYVTILTGGVGFLIAILSIGSSVPDPVQVILVACGLVFIVGLLVYAQIISLGGDLYRANRRLALVRDQIGDAAQVENYLSRLRRGGLDLGDEKKKRLSLWQHIRNGVRTIGLQTQIVILNSIVGTFGLLIWMNAMKGYSGNELLVSGILSLIFLALIQLGYYSVVRERGEY